MEKKHSTCVEVTNHTDLVKGIRDYVCNQDCPSPHVPVTKTPGQAAFDEWASAHNLDTKWRFVPEDSKARWEKIAIAAINQHIDNRDAINQGYTSL